eukprot:CCRYP_020722-RA/>CCRYP_020722-RA protein AED:0.43 eAED:0.62 QI:0/0/0/1/0/0/2/0/121
MENWSFQKPFNSMLLFGTTAMCSTLDTLDSKKPFLLQCTGKVNKRHKHKYGQLPTKFVITNPWKLLCVKIIGPYTIKGKDGTVIDVMCLTMIDPASSWFQIVELLVITEVIIPLDSKGRKC